jgi:hypothetical protein
MNTFHLFTLILKNVNENTPHLEDSLYEAGCDDALINFRNNAVFLDFERKAVSFEDAVVSAIRNVESASVHPRVAHVAPEDLVTMSEAAERLNRTRQALSLWIKQARRQSTEKPFPAPAMKLAEKSPLWKWREIVEWLYFHNLIKEKSLLEKAIAIQRLNGVLEERDQEELPRKILLDKLSSR